MTARITGSGELIGLAIDPRVVESGPPAQVAEAIADLVLAAVRNANHDADELRAEAMGPIADALGGLGLPGRPGA